MGWFNRFRASLRPSRTGPSQEDHRRLAAALGEVRVQVLNLDAQVGTIHLALRRHEDEIAACRELADRQMSYADVAAVLGKSAYTVKNQMNQIRHKADLFDCVIGPQSRHFFRLKDDLKVEKHLKAGRPMARPVSMAESDRSSSEHTAAPADRTF